MNFELELKGFRELESTFADLARKDEKIHKAAVKAGGAVLVMRKLMRKLRALPLAEVIRTLTMIL
nr:hypothetical protein [Bacillus velezensis]